MKVVYLKTELGKGYGAWENVRPSASGLENEKILSKKYKIFPRYKKIGLIYSVKLSSGLPTKKTC